MKAKEKPRDSVTKPLTVVGRVAKLLVGTCICTIFFLIGTGSQAMQKHSETTTSILVSQSSRDTRPDAVTKLVAGVPRTNDYFGTSVAVSGDTAIVGAPVAASGSPNDNGAAYIYVRNGSGWSLQQRLFASDSPADDRDGFGLSVAISGDTAVVGAPRRGDPNDEAGYGAVYIFARNGATWTLQKKLSPIDTPLAECESEFGRSVAISGDTVLASTGGCIESGDNESVVHVFVRTGAAWAPQTMLLSPSVPNDDFFGTSVALQGDMAIVGDPGDSTGTRPETASVFYRCGTVWTRQQTLSASDGASAERSFGTSVAISGNSVIIGAKDDRLGTANRIQGSAYVFTSDGTTWTEQQKLTQDDGSLSSRFGSSVAIFGNIAVIGKPVSVTANQGSAFTFGRSGNTWTLQDTYTAGDGAAGDEFGSSVAISANAVIVGARLDDAGTTQTNEGSAYAIDRTSAPPAGFSPPCENSITVNITTDQQDANLSDEICDVDLLTSGNQCSLRAAIQTANAKPGPDEIKFNIPGTGVHTISPTSNLPSITEKVFVNGSSQPDYAGDRPLIELAGTFSGTSATGLLLAPGSDASQIKALTINRFGSNGIELQSNDNVIERCFIGTSADGNNFFPKSQNFGIKISGARNRVGAADRTAAAANSTIAGNQLAQVVITSPGASANVIVGTNIGIFANGEFVDDPDGLDGISVENGASNNQIGGSTFEALNDITGLVGIDIALSTGTKITGNVISYCASGVFTHSSTNTVIGGARTLAPFGEGNVFDWNEVGVRVDSEAPLGPRSQNSTSMSFETAPTGGGPPSRNTKILGNTFRVSDPMLVPQGRPTAAVGVAEAEDTLIGADGFENIILDCTNAGIIIRKEANRTIIQRNLIGDNGHQNRIGIRLTGNGTQVIRNRIGFSSEAGIVIDKLEDADPTPVNNLIQDNRIGTDVAGNAASPNAIGIVIDGNQNTVDNNTISGNQNSGIDLFGNQNTISENRLGTNINGTAAIPNFSGMVIYGSNNSILRNTVSGNTVGISIASFEQTGPSPEGNMLKGNFVGTNSAGNAAIPNSQDGIVLANARTTLIGGFGPNIPADRNVISGNGRHGITLISGSTQNRISGNYVGVALDGTTPLGNAGTGIRVGVSTSNTMIGGPEQNAGNTIAYNGINGISLTSDAGNNNIIDPNRIFGNALAGIDIGENGLTPNDPTDADVGPNKLQNFPTFTLSIVGGDLIVNYRVDSAPQHSSYGASGIYVEFFKADATGAGRDFLGSDHYLLSDYSNGQPGIRQKNLGNAASLGVAAGDSLTATATDADGNSSEFTPAFPVSSAPVTISGRVTTPTGLGLRNATVTLIAPSGERRLATTSSFGIYNFADVSSGLSYTITVTSKRYRFAPRIQTISQSASNLDFTGLE